MLFRVRLYRVPAPTLLEPRPAAREEPGFAVEAFTFDRARAAVVSRLRDLGQRVRSVSHTPDNGFVAVVTSANFNAEDPPTPTPTPVPPAPGGGTRGYGGGGYGGGEYGG